MRKGRIKWSALALPVVWFISIAIFIALYCYAWILRSEWTTGFLVIMIYYYLLPQGVLFGILFGRKEGTVWNFKWLLPAYYFFATWFLLGRWSFSSLWLFPAGGAFIGLILGFSVHQIRKWLRQRQTE